MQLFLLLSIILLYHINSQNISISIEYLENKAMNETKGYANIYVANALVMGGFKIHGYNTAAYNFYYKNILENAGFKIIGNESNIPNFLRGDIMVNLNSSKHPYGHICMYNGTKWFSDYVQNSIYTYLDEIDIPTIFFRYKDVEDNTIINDDNDTINTNNTDNTDNTDNTNSTNNNSNNNNKSKSCYCYENFMDYDDEQEENECTELIVTYLLKEICPLLPDENNTEEEIDECELNYFCGSEKTEEKNKTHYLNLSILFYFILFFFF